MTAAEMKTILKAEYGIANEKEFEIAVAECTGINIGVFVTQIKSDLEQHLALQSGLIRK